MAKSIFIQRKVEKLFKNYIEYNWIYNGGCGYSHLPKINEINKVFTIKYCKSYYTFGFVSEINVMRLMILCSVSQCHWEKRA